MQNVDKKIIEEIIRNIIIEKLNLNTSEFEKHKDRSGIMSIKTSSVKLEKFETGKEKDKVFLKDIMTLEESPRLGCGLMEMEESSFAWTLKYDEIDYIIDGVLEVEIDGRKVAGYKGDIIFIPKNSSINFTAPKYAKFMYVTYPANWAEQI